MRNLRSCNVCYSFRHFRYLPMTGSLPTVRIAGAPVRLSYPSFRSTLLVVRWRLTSADLTGGIIMNGDGTWRILRTFYEGNLGRRTTEWGPVHLCAWKADTWSDEQVHSTLLLCPYPPKSYLTAKENHNKYDKSRTVSIQSALGMEEE